MPIHWQRFNVIYCLQKLTFLVTLNTYSLSLKNTKLLLKLWKNSGWFKMLREIFMNLFRFFGADLQLYLLYFYFTRIITSKISETFCGNLQADIPTFQKRFRNVFETYHFWFLWLEWNVSETFLKRFLLCGFSSNLTSMIVIWMFICLFITYGPVKPNLVQKDHNN